MFPSQPMAKVGSSRLHVACMKVFGTKMVSPGCTTPTGLQDIPAGEDLENCAEACLEKVRHGPEQHRHCTWVMTHFFPQTV